MNNNIKLDSNYVTGFTDAEGCFHISIVDKPGARLKKKCKSYISNNFTY